MAVQHWRGAGAVCLVLAGLTLAFGLKPLIFSSGSMGPAIPTGSLALAVPVAAADISPGEVVSVVASNGTRITHRVVSVDPASGLFLKGDANAVADLQPYTGATVDRVLLSVPGLGFVVSWLASPWVFLLGGMLCAYLIYAAFFRSGSGGARKSRSGRGRGKSATSAGAGKPGPRHRSWLRSGAVIAALAVVIPLGALNKVEPTQAAWISQATANSSVTAAVMPAPSNLTCQPSGSGDRAVTIGWSTPVNPPAPAAGYTVTVTVKDQSKSESVAAQPVSKTVSLDEGTGGLLGGVLNLVGGLVQSLLGGSQPVTVSVAAQYPGNWQSTAMTTTGIATISQPLFAPAVIKCN